MLLYVGLAAGALAAAHLALKDAFRRSRETDILLQFERLFNVPLDRLCQLRDDMAAAMEAGLQPGSGEARPGVPPLLMLPSFVDVLPTGAESGDCYAIDLGGTNLRVTHVRLAESTGLTESTHMRQWPIPEECFNTDNGRLLQWTAERAAEVLAEWHTSPEPPVIGFCFSFPVEQTALDNGRIVGWTKSFHGARMLGSDAVQGLRAAFASLGLPVRIPAILNDTVATLLALRYSEPDARLGLILGTGTNCAYVERLQRIKKLPPGFRGRSEWMAVNTEWGEFRSPALPLAEEDLWIDCSSPNPGGGTFEKLISGLYLGEIARRLLLRLAREARLFGPRPPLALHREYSLESRLVAAVDHDASPDLAATGAALAEWLGMARSTVRQRRVVRRVCQLAALRSARLAAAATAGVLKHAGYSAGDGSGGGGGGGRVVVAVDGSVFAKYDKYKDLMMAALRELCGPEAAAAVELQLALDGSMLGAAVLAVAAQGWADAHGSGGSGGGESGGGR